MALLSPRLLGFLLTQQKSVFADMAITFICTPVKYSVIMLQNKYPVPQLLLRAYTPLA